MSQLQSQLKLPEGYSRLDFTKVGKHKVKLLTDWVTPFGTIPKGYESDGASIPRLLWWFSHPFGELLEGSIPHDYFYEHALETKDYADHAFKEVVTAFKDINQTKPWKIKVAYFLVRKFGRGKYPK